MGYRDIDHEGHPLDPPGSQVLLELSPLGSSDFTLMRMLWL